MRIIRVCRAKYPDLDGKGAALSGGRWNSPGTQMVYASSCGALAVLEYRVNTKRDPGDLRVYTIEFPDTLRMEKTGWMPDLRTARQFGDVWINGNRSVILAVPSVLVPHQINYLLNPEHPDFAASVQIVENQPFLLDVRLFDITPPHSVP
jgi:RES domain-containing protein